MITFRANRERRHDARFGREVWHTFYPTAPEDPFPEGFGLLEFLDEDWLPPGGAVPLRHRRDAEILTYVCDGELAWEDSTGCAGVVRTGEFQRMTGGHGVRHVLRNASEADWARVFRIWLRPVEGRGEPGYEQRRFTAAERRGRLLLIASPDARSGSLRIQQGARVYAALLDPGQHLLHELSPGRSAWIHVMQGEVTLDGVVLAAGDGAGVTDALAASLMGRSAASILLLDVGEQPTRLPSLSGAALFGMLWEELVDVLGPTATATLVRRAARRALPRSPELVELDVARVDGEFRYSLPPSFERADAPPAPLRELLDELRPLLAELTGQVVFRRLERVPQLREWASVAL